MFEALQEELEELSRQGLYRFWRRIDELQGARIRIDGRWLINFGSNSYLGLHQHPRVIAAAKEALERFGTGCGSARLIGGTLSLHEELEASLARFKGTPAALLFPTGYMANLGVVTALVKAGDLILSDALNHASIIDACRLSGAAFRVYPHRDVERLEAALQHRRGKYRRILIITEGLFSMEGGIAPLPEILSVARRHGAWLLVDEAHATGVLGKTGRGTLEHFGPAAEGPLAEGILQMGTLSKALGSLGGFIAGPKEVVELLKNRARSFIYTTALPPASAAAALGALKVIEEEPIWLARLWENTWNWIRGLERAGCQLLSRESPIVPVGIGGNAEVTELSRELFEAGLYAPGIRPPTVPAGSARIRTSVTALHTEDELEAATISFEKGLKRGRIGALRLASSSP